MADPAGEIVLAVKTTMNTADTTSTPAVPPQRAAADTIALCFALSQPEFCHEQKFEIYYCRIRACQGVTLLDVWASSPNPFCTMFPQEKCDPLLVEALNFGHLTPRAAPTCAAEACVGRGALSAPPAPCQRRQKILPRSYFTRKDELLHLDAPGP